MRLRSSAISAIPAIPALVAVAALAACGSPRPCEGVRGVCVELTAGRSTEPQIAAAFAGAADGSTLAFGAGTFTFTAGLAVTARNVTVKGAGSDQTTLDFHGATAAEQGLLGDRSDGITISDLAVQDAAGRAVLVRAAAGVTFRRVAAGWTNPDPRRHGSHGLSAVGCRAVLVDACAATGATEVGLHVAQSQGAEVRGSTVQSNGAGVELDSTSGGDVHDNVVTLNSAGVVVADLSGPGGDARGVRVRDNQILSNNVARLPVAGGTAALLPAGSGVIVVAGRQVEVSGNLIKGNRTVGLLVVSDYAAGLPFGAGFDPYPAQVYAHDDNFVSNGGRPDPASALGKLLSDHLEGMPDLVVPSIVWDGLYDPSGPGGTNPQRLCARSNTGTGIVNLNRDQLGSDGSNFASVVSYDPAPFDCALPPLP